MGTKAKPDSPWEGNGVEEYADERYIVVVKPMTIYKSAIRDGVPRTEVYTEWTGMSWYNVTKLGVLGMEQVLQRAYNDLNDLGPKYDLVKRGVLPPEKFFDDDTSGS